jgi:hypothetical protein
MSVSGIPLRSPWLRETRHAVTSLRLWPVRRWATALVATVAAALIMGVPTGIVETGLYTRMTPVLWWNYPVWAASALIVGLTAATYVRAGAGPVRLPDRSRRTVAATLVSTFRHRVPDLQQARRRAPRRERRPQLLGADPAVARGRQRRAPRRGTAGAPPRRRGLPGAATRRATLNSYRP